MTGDYSTKFIQATRNDRVEKRKWLLTNDTCKGTTQEKQNIWMDISEATRVSIARYVTPVFNHKDNNRIQCDGILRKDSK